MYKKEGIEDNVKWEVSSINYLIRKYIKISVRIIAP